MSAHFEVTPWVHVLGGLVERHKGLWIRLGQLETKLLADELETLELRAPIYIAGLARAGSTLLLELLDRHPDTVAHRYRDYPLMFTPYLWNRFLDRTPQRDETPVERSHHDGIMITPDSPEAFEEVLWMAFHPDLHQPGHSAVLDADARHPEFERFYRDHIRKLLKVRGGSRYLSKGNYNVTRLSYLAALFPDARIVIPMRDPVWHVASLMKQHALFCRAQRGNPKALIHLQRVGHYEFGLDRRPINLGDDATTQQITALWAEGREVEGWALYWGLLHDFLARCLEQDSTLREATMIVPFDRLCQQPQDTVEALLAHCRLQPSRALVEHAGQRIQAPSYYRPDFTRQDLEIIERHTAAAEARLLAAA